MDDIPTDNELNALLGGAAPTDADLGLLDWTPTFEFDDAVFGTDGDALQHGSTVAGSLGFHASTTGALPPPQSTYITGTSFMDTVPSSLLCDPSYGGAPYSTPMDVSWPAHSGQVFVPSLWGASPSFTIQKTNTMPSSFQNPGLTASQLLYEDGEVSSDIGKKKKKKRRRLPESSKKLLEASFVRHKDNPYVTLEEAEGLAIQTGLSVKQIRTYFANQRARKLPPAPHIDNPSSKGERSRSPSNHESPKIAAMDTPSADTTQQGPMERFLSSSPEDEGISEEAVRRAAESMDTTISIPSPTKRRRLYSKADAMSVSDAAYSSNSGGSSSSHASVDSANSRGPRRGRMRRQEPTEKSFDSIMRKPTDPHKLYQCTFCTREFAQKYDWRRHEESVHFPQQEWICMPDGPTYTSPKECGARCVFCDEKDPLPGHLESHHTAHCIAAPRPQRTFLRKDKLIQHLIQVHRSGQLSKATRTWCRPVERTVTLMCGFCGQILSDWASRVDHMASHFIEGITMEMWLIHPGGIWAIDFNKVDLSNYQPQPSPEGDFQCKICHDCFVGVIQIILHHRQVHGIFSEDDRKFTHIFKTPSGRNPPLLNRELIDLARMRFAVETTEMDSADPRFRRPAPLSSPPQERVERTKNRRSRTFNSTPLPPLVPVPGPTLSPDGHANIVRASSQSLVSTPHANWTGSTVMRSTTSASLLSDYQVDKIRRNRSGLSNVTTPAQGIFHSLEQLPPDSMAIIDDTQPFAHPLPEQSQNPNLAGTQSDSSDFVPQNRRLSLLSNPAILPEALISGRTGNPHDEPRPRPMIQTASLPIGSGTGAAHFFVPFRRPGTQANIDVGTSSSPLSVGGRGEMQMDVSDSSCGAGISGGGVKEYYSLGLGALLEEVRRGENGIG
ncbi:hypothetical protein CC78DRAFT_576032 [Lojkania enalia]|uniref:Homeobox domain-containing protein n=1 Tax=Lojkania enalia TaxID=147567 RepID=A0A9P4KHW9_9PLEO|nr:hypothetical protein CC78DRAFT_576032 [Didymosphaeria enalia]